MNKKLIAPIVTAAAMLATSVGSTFALFSSKASSRIDINAGKLDVKLEKTALHTYSVEADESGDRVDEHGYKYSSKLTADEGVFTNGGTAEFEGSNLALDAISPGDRVVFDLKASQGDTNISYKYRVVLEYTAEDEMIGRGMEITTNISGQSKTYKKLKKYQSAWKLHDISGDALDLELSFDMELHVTCGNEYQEKVGAYSMYIEAVQGNAAVTGEELIEYFPDTSYGFANSYQEADGHWVHEISDADQFRNIVDSTTHDKKTKSYGYPGAHEKDTVYLITENIDFGGEVWNTDELINEVNTYPFIGHLVGADGGKELSNVHVDKAYCGLDDAQNTWCFFGRAVNASFEDLTISDCSINTSSGDKSAILCAGNKTTASSYKTLFEDPSFSIDYIEFKNILIKENCSVSVHENGAGICACLRNFSDHILFENCVNYANVRADENNVAGILGQASNNPETGAKHSTKVTIKNCENFGMISGNGNAVGGIVGNLCSYNGTCENCTNHGDIKHKSTGNTVGSIIGNNSANSGVKFINCVNEGMIYTQKSGDAFKIYDYTIADLKVLYNGKSIDEVSLDEFKSLFVREYNDKVIDVSYDKTTNKVHVDTSDGADHYTMVISTTKVDIDMATNKAVPERSGSLTLCSFDNLTPTKVDSFALIRQFGYFAPGPGECPVDEHHGGTRIGSRGIKCTSEYFLDYSLRGQEDYKAGYGENSKGGYFILDNTGCTEYYPCLITWRVSVTYSVVGYDADGKVISSGKVVYAPYSLGGDNNYTTEIVGYTPDVM